jgi:hypothetical protein
MDTELEALLKAWEAVREADDEQARELKAIYRAQLDLLSARTGKPTDILHRRF